MKKLIVSFSGGLTSAFMAQEINERFRDRYEIVYIFANTGKEKEATLMFVEQCSRHFGLDVVWVEAITHPKHGKGVTAKVVDYKTAARCGEPFEAMIAKHGIPNSNTPFCSKELKARAIKAYARSIGWKKYYTAIGIRTDEADRINERAKKERLVYPLISWFPTDRSRVHRFWRSMPFTLNLKSYEGNCNKCWKKSLRKLMTIEAEEREAGIVDLWWTQMEDKYGHYTPKSRQHNPNIKLPHRFYRENRSAAEIREMSQGPFKRARDESKDVNNQQTIFNLDDTVLDEYVQMDLGGGCEESCEPF